VIREDKCSTNTSAQEPTGGNQPWLNGKLLSYTETSQSKPESLVRVESAAHSDQAGAGDIISVKGESLATTDSANFSNHMTDFSSGQRGILKLLPSSSEMTLNSRRVSFSEQNKMREYLLEDEERVSGGGTHYLYTGIMPTINICKGCIV